MFHINERVLTPDGFGTIISIHADTNLYSILLDTYKFNSTCYSYREVDLSPPLFLNIENTIDEQYE